MRQSIVGAIVLLAISAVTPAGDAPPPSAKNPAGVKAEDIAKDYAHLTLMTKEPVYVDPHLAMLCRGASQSDVERAQKRSGPHAHTRVRIFMNDLAAQGFKEGSTAYPVGAVVVKEKQGMTYFPDEPNRGPTRTHDGVGGMIKRDKGYDPDHGDWEYFYFEDSAKVESGKIASCVQCHGGAARTDYVFGAWAPKKPTESNK